MISLGRRKKRYGRKKEALFTNKKIGKDTVRDLRKAGHKATIRKKGRGNHIVTYQYKVD